jgi:hypothetical protein
MEHNDDILCLDVFKNLVVTGQIGFNPFICVWEVNSNGIDLKYTIRGDL